MEFKPESVFQTGCGKVPRALSVCTCMSRALCESVLGRAHMHTYLRSLGVFLMPRHPGLPPAGTPEMPKRCCPSGSVSPGPTRGSACVRVCVRVPSLARALFVFLLIGLFFHVQPTKPHVFPLISPARLGWSPRHARGLPEAGRGGGAGGPQPWPAQIRLRRAGQGRAGPFQLQPCPGPTHTPQGPWPVPTSSCGIP